MRVITRTLPVLTPRSKDLVISSSSPPKCLLRPSQADHSSTSLGARHSQLTSSTKVSPSRLNPVTSPLVPASVLGVDDSVETGNPEDRGLDHLQCTTNNPLSLLFPPFLGFRLLKSPLSAPHIQPRCAHFGAPSTQGRAVTGLHHALESRLNQAVGFTKYQLMKTGQPR